MRHIFPAPLMAFLIALTLFPIGTASANDTLELTDGMEDVVWRGFRTRHVEGYGEIDILSLTSAASIQDVEITLKMDDDIANEVGYIYSISASGINIAYTEGQFSTWRWENGVVEVDNVQTGVNGDTITCVVPRASLAGDLVLNATAQYYIPAAPGSHPENYFDGTGDFGDGTRAAPSIVDLSRDYDDPSGDVEMSYYDERSHDDGSVDILSLSAVLGEDLRLTLSMRDDIVDDGTTDYSFFAAGIEVRYAGGMSAWVIEDGEEDDRIDDVEVSGSDMTLIVPGSYTEGSLGPVLAKVQKEGDRGSYLLDMVPDDPYSYDDLLPFPPGGREVFRMEVKGPGAVVLGREFSDFTDQQSEDMRNTIDSNVDLYISEDEVDRFFLERGSSSLEEVHEGDLTMDGRTGSLTVSLETRGLVGDVDSAEDVHISWSLDYEFDPPNREVHSIEMDVPNDPFSGLLMDIQGTVGTSLHLIVELNRTWRFDPLTLEPSIISNYMDLDARTVDMEMEPEAASLFRVGDIEFDIYMRQEKSDDDDVRESGEDAGNIWIYILILVVMVIVVIVLYTWSKSREMD